MNIPPQVFLGGSCGSSRWRAETAIPLLREAGITFHDPQLPEGSWTPEDQFAEMEAKARADVWLFVVTAETRGVAAVAECAYRIGQRGRLALALMDLPADAVLGGVRLTPREVDDLNRGRVFLRAMAREHSVPVFETVAEATRHAVHLAREARGELDLGCLRAVLQRVALPGFEFIPEIISGELFVRIQRAELDHERGVVTPMLGRRWLIERGASESDVVRTLLKAVLTWQEHEIREQFLFEGRRVFDPHVAFPSHGDPGHP
ncbi:MAG: hypothetical protein JNL10_11875 [Verrucomicrobiales bacterium]|nr:hypothetical protein [Verrucomicrobiales bacterium]